MEHSYELLGVVLKYLPNGKVQAKVVTQYNLCDTEEERTLLLIGVLNDGIRHGNWPTP